jgi:hypothetical protein
MRQQPVLANCILWAAAILASAILGAPSTLTCLLLPALAATSWLISVRRASAGPCCPRAPIQPSVLPSDHPKALGQQETHQA